MSRRMINPQTIIKSQVLDDKLNVDLNKILEKYGCTSVSGLKSVTIQTYIKEVTDFLIFRIVDDTGAVCGLIPNGSFTISKHSNGNIMIAGMIVESPVDLSLVSYKEIPNGNYKKGIILQSSIIFDLYIIKV